MDSENTVPISVFEQTDLLNNGLFNAIYSFVATYSIIFLNLIGNVAFSKLAKIIKLIFKLFCNNVFKKGRTYYVISFQKAQKRQFLSTFFKSISAIQNNLLHCLNGHKLTKNIQAEMNGRIPSISDQN